MSTNPILMPTRAFYLPELLDLIGNDLDTRDLLSCVQVCRVWNQHFMPILWATIDDKLYSWPKILWRFSPLAPGFLHGNNPWLNNVFTKHGRHIRHLTAGWATTIISISAAATVTGLESLSVVQPSGFSSESVFSVRGTTPLWIPPLLQDFLPPTTRKCKYRNLSVQDFVQRFWSLVIHNSSLKSIELAQECQLDDFPIPVPSLLKALATLRNLTKLVNNMAAIDLQMVLEYLPALSFYSGPIGWVDYRLTTTDLELTTVFPNLRTLQLSTILRRPQCEQPFLQHTTALNLLRHLSNLDQLSFDGIWNFVHPPPGSTAAGNGVLPDSRTIVNNSNSSVQDFHFVRAGRVSSSSMRDFIALDILPRMPHLTRLTLQTLTQTAGKALAKYCSQLEWLQLRTTKYDSMDQDSITPLLHHCPRLRHLDAIWHTVEANSLVKKPVVCRGMEVFRCKITGIGEEDEEDEEGHDNELEDGPWENPAEDYNSDDQEDDDEETTAIKIQGRLLDHHQHIYDELGRWTELRVLELGVDNVDWYDIMGSDPGRHLVDGRIYYNYFGPTPNTLPLSLESGLNRLRTLKKLEVIGFEGVDHRINTGELAWMAENWPKLQVMHGFQAPDEKDEYALRCPKVKGLREYMQGLRPLVRHEPRQEQS